EMTFEQVHTSFYQALIRIEAKPEIMKKINQLRRTKEKHPEVSSKYTEFAGISEMKLPGVDSSYTGRCLSGISVISLMSL
ncbi:12202_t:CDS:2, partial [Gigaspora rosea]